MVVRLKDALIESIDETETKKLRILTATSKEGGAVFSIELPDVLSSRLSARETVDVILDEEPIADGDKARVYGEGVAYKVTEEGTYELVGTVGGLRIHLSLVKATPSQKKTFSQGKFYFGLF
ncbi:MAG: hypothetical protein HXY34_01000 [Candidatus Thorarchaeota archaeon]|nr:hypothetical protein [Candidatus Thorarchaeota archaeon]